MADEDYEGLFEAFGGSQETVDAFNELAARKRDQKLRARMCSLYAETLRALGRLIWVQGSIVGPDRASGKSPHGFGNDDVVGLGTVWQITAQLADGAINLLKAENH